jgi:hypothetical protein
LALNMALVRATARDGKRSPCRGARPPLPSRARSRTHVLGHQSLGVGAERTADACVSSRIACGSPSQPPPEEEAVMEFTDSEPDEGG